MAARRWAFRCGGGSAWVAGTSPAMTAEEPQPAPRNRPRQRLTPSQSCYNQPPHPSPGSPPWRAFSSPALPTALA
jgi:hypothetical protein